MNGGTPTRIERFLAHLDDVTGGTEPRFFPIPNTREGTAGDVGGMTAIIYLDMPQPGFLTAFTYGLSTADHPDWVLGKPELCICVESNDANWGMAMAYIAEQLRGECNFSVGGLIDFGGPMSEESAMSSLVFFAPAVLEPVDYLGIDVGDELPINIVGCYPIHAEEHDYIRTHGLRDFWEQEWDPYDVRRAPCVG